MIEARRFRRATYMLGLRQAAKVGDGVHVALKVSLDGGELHFDNNLTPVVKSGLVRLPNGSCAQWVWVKLCENLLQLPSQAPFDNVLEGKEFKMN